jgi:hypothetical protein
MFVLEYIQKENDLNKIIRKQKRSKGTVNILFTSLWDDMSLKAEKLIEEAYGQNTEGDPLYIVNSFDVPHSFVIYNTTKLPHLVRLKKDRVVSEDYYSKVLENLGL